MECGSYTEDKVTFKVKNPRSTTIHAIGLVQWVETIVQHCLASAYLDCSLLRRSLWTPWAYWPHSSWGPRTVPSMERTQWIVVSRYPRNRIVIRDQISGHRPTNMTVLIRFKNCWKSWLNLFSECINTFDQMMKRTTTGRELINECDIFDDVLGHHHVFVPTFELSFGSILIKTF